MNLRRTLFISFVLSLLFFSVMSVCFLFMPAVVNGENRTRSNVIALGVTFWAAGLLGYLSVVLSSISRKRICKDQRIHIKGRAGVVSFISNVPALLFDAGLLISIVLFAVAMLTELKTSYFAYVSISLFVFFLHMHALFNGKNYHILSQRNKRSRKHHGHFEK